MSAPSLVTNNSTLSNTALGYENELIKLFTIAAVFWGIVGMSLGVYIVCQLAFP